MSFQRDGWGPLALLSVSRWTKGGSGRMKFGRILALNVAPNYSFKVWVLIPGCWDGGAGRQGASIFVSLKMTGFPIKECRRKYNGV